MHRYAKIILTAALFYSFAGTAYAQVCKEPGGQTKGKANLNCDMTYRETVVTCDRKEGNTTSPLGTRPACPKKPMPMIDTPKRSYIADYSPYLFTYPRDATDKTRPYAGAYSIGTPGDAAKTFQLFGNTAPGTKRMASCTTQLKLPSDPKNAREEAAFVRLQMDNCTNQYILNDAIFPYQKESTNLLSGEDPNNAAKRIDLQSECQPLKTFRDTTNEYSASEYLQVAWKKLLQDPGYRKTTTGSKGIACNYAKVGGNVLSGTEYDGLTIPCDREPHLPNGITIENPLKPPNELKSPAEAFPEVLLSSISAVPYEQIIDPTHPFSPRWDFLITDREYSKVSPAWASVPKAAAIYALHSIYMKDPKDTIYCAGVKKADKESDAKKKRDLTVPVDVLEFRRGKFEEALFKRVLYNDVCYEHRAQFTSGQDAWWMVLLLSYCNQITGFSFVYPYVYGKDFNCWECFGLNGKVDDEQSHPPCTTNYLGKDLKMKLNKPLMFPGLFNMFSRSAQCNGFMGARQDKYRMDLVCKDLRKPYTQLNKLKMRYHNMESDSSNNSGSSGSAGDDNVLVDGYGTSKNGALEGMTFKEYFGNHMPYPRVWDVGSSLQKTPNTDANDQPPLDTTGQYTAIVGVGREAAAKTALDGSKSSGNSSSGSSGSSSSEKEEAKDQRCKAMGWRSPLLDIATSSTNTYGVEGLFAIETGGVKVYAPDPLTSWTEMKLYQARTLRNVGLSCIGRYEKVFKPGSAENMVLLASGAEWSRMIISKCAKDKFGKTKDCTYMTLKEYTKESKKKDSESSGEKGDDAGGKKDDSTIYLKQLESNAWPNAWRGYMASGGLDITAKTKFPLFGDGSIVGLGSQVSSTGVSTGLDDTLAYTIGLNNAQLGDIVMLPFGARNNPIPVPTDSDLGLAKLAFVIETNLPKESNCEEKKNCYVKVLEPDNGKWPDVCGTTDTWGEMKSRYYFKPGHLPNEAVEEYKRIKSTQNCEETRLSHCEMSSWSNLAIYRIRNDVLKGCENKKLASECKEDKK